MSKSLAVKEISLLNMLENWNKKQTEHDYESEFSIHMNKTKTIFMTILYSINLMGLHFMVPASIWSTACKKTAKKAGFN